MDDRIEPDVAHYDAWYCGAPYPVVRSGDTCDSAAGPFRDLAGKPWHWARKEMDNRGVTLREVRR